MSCARTDDAGAWVLHALEDLEADDYAAHQIDCVDCRRAVQRLSLSADSLPLAAPQVTPHDALKSRLMATVSAEAQLLRAAGPTADVVPAAKPRRGRRSWLPSLGFRPVAVGLAAVLLIAVGVAGGVAVTDSGEVEPSQTVLAEAPGAAAVAVMVTGEHAALRVERLPRAPTGRVYQVWLVRADGKPRPTRTLFDVPAAGGTRVDIEEPVDDGVRGILVTHEPRGGSTTPSGAPLITADI